MKFNLVVRAKVKGMDIKMCDEVKVGTKLIRSLEIDDIGNLHPRVQGTNYFERELSLEEAEQLACFDEEWEVTVFVSHTILLNYTSLLVRDQSYSGYAKAVGVKFDWDTFLPDLITACDGKDIKYILTPAEFNVLNTKPDKVLVLETL